MRVPGDWRSSWRDFRCHATKISARGDPGPKMPSPPDGGDGSRGYRGSVNRRDRHPHPQALAGVVVQPRHVDLATLAIFHVIADDPSLLADRVDLAATGLRGCVVSTVIGDPVADRATGHRTGHRGRGPPVALAHGMAQHPADHRAEHGTSRAVAGVALHHLLVIALLLRHVGAADSLYGIGPQYIGPTVMGIVVIVGIRRILRLRTHRHRRHHQCGNPYLDHDPLPNSMQNRCAMRVLSALQQNHSEYT